MTKQAFLDHVAALYRAANMADSDNPARPVWMKPAMCGDAGCAALDKMLYAMLECEAISGEEHQAFYDAV